MAEMIGDKMGEVNFNICCEIASWLLLELLLGSYSVVGEKLNSVMPCEGKICDRRIVFKSVWVIGG